MVVVVTRERKRTRLGPSLNNQIMGLMKSIMRNGGIQTKSMILGANPTNKTTDESATRQDINHGMLFCNRKGMLSKR